ncbi:MAG TPA: LPXTG cell wall anchor domain-containing protein, partial [Acidimicrobiia bacterium]|nr:LPXTG cell wall anchor domain-containing protein [Acidimicrobiia bacterium]
PPPAPMDRRPSEAVRPPAEAPQRLPQTAADSRPLAVAGGASLVAAGLAWIGGARRRKKRAAA